MSHVAPQSMHDHGETLQGCKYPYINHYIGNHYPIHCTDELWSM